jgi:hypothetical protein
MGTRVLAATSLALAALAGGCGAASDDDSSADFRGQQALAASTVEDLSSAAADGDESEICGQLLATALVDRLSARGSNCRAAVEDALEDTDAADLDVRAVRIAGTAATARVAVDTGDEDRVVSVGLVRERGRWKIARLPA